MAKQYINVKILVEVSKHKLYTYIGEEGLNVLNYITAKCMKSVYLWYLHCYELTIIYFLFICHYLIKNNNRDE